MYLPTNSLGFKTQISLSLSYHMQEGGFAMENMSFDDLDLLLGVTEITCSVESVHVLT
jgi:hypothetical protein